MKLFKACSLTLLTAAAAFGAKKPNVLIFFADDVGWGDIRCYNDVDGAIMKTPNIDRLATQGMRFTDAHSRSLCAPSRYSVLTGNYPFRTKQLGWVISASSSVQPGQKTMAEMFQELGYHTSFFGKWHMGGQLYGKDGNVIPSNFKKEWKNVDWSKPMYKGPVSLGFDYSFLSHSGVQGGPYFYLENDKMIGDPEQIMVWEARFHDNKDNPYKTEIEATDYGLPEWDSTKVGEHYTQKALDFIDRHVAEKPDQPFFMHFCTQCIHTPMTPGEFMGKKVAGETGHVHTDMLYEMDLQFGALLDRLEKHGELENTIVIFTSDNGPWEALSPESYDSSAHFRGYKGQGYEAGHRVPFIIRWDGKIKPGSVCDRLIDQVDLLPSFAAMFGGTLETDDALDGLDVSSYFFGDESRELRDFQYAKGRIQKDSLVDFKFAEFSYRRYGYKILVSNKNQHLGEVMEMYRLKTDQEEKTNLANHPEHKKMKAKLLKEMKELHRSKRSTPAFGK
jgi:arylsulfatase A-like enzyme